jgi:hypothetical protein
MQAISSLVTAIICLAYGIYCMLYDSTPNCGKGWVSSSLQNKSILIGLILRRLIVRKEGLSFPVRAIVSIIHDLPI